MGNLGIVWKKAGLVCLMLAALAIVAYAQTGERQRGRSANLQVAMSAGYLGVGVQDITPERAKALNLKDTSGVEVTAIDERSPAASAGVRKQDVILEVNGQKFEGQDQFAEIISGKAPGTKVNLIVLRNGGKQTVAATLALRAPELGFAPGAAGMLGPGGMSPEALQAMVMGAQNAVDAPKAGFDCVDLMPQLADFFGVQAGVLVESVTSRSPAERAGLKAGDIVTKVNGIPVANSREISFVIRQANKKLIAFTVVRNKKEVTLNIELASNRADQPDRNPAN